MALVAWYKLDGNALDSSGNGHHGTVGSGTFVPGKIREGISFNGVSPNIIQCGNITSGMSTITMACWIYPTESFTQTTGFVSNLYHRNSNTSNPYDNRGMCLRTDSSGRLGVTYGFKNGSEYNRAGYTTSAVIPLNEWSHIACTFDGEVLIVYMNGQLIGEHVRDIIVDGETQFVIGRWGSHYSNYFFTGVIDDVRIYDHALSLKKLKELAKAKILHYRMDDFQEPTENLIDVGAYTLYSNNGGVYPIQKENYEDHFRVRRNSDFSTYPSATLSCYTNVFYDSVAGKQYAHSVYVKPEKDVRLSLATSNYVLCSWSLNKIRRVLSF